MDCDGVFMELTRAPFPSGGPLDRAVNRHVRSCPECRRIAEALRPDDDLRHESLGSAERSSLPRYLGVDASLPMAFAAASAVGSSSGSRGTRAASAGLDGSGSATSPYGPARLNDEIATQVAAFTLASSREESRAADLLSLVALGAATVVGVGGLAWLAL